MKSQYAVLILSIIIAIFTYEIIACPMHQEAALRTDIVQQDTLWAISILQPDGGTTVNGNVKLRQEAGITYIKATVYNIPVGLHGIHIHQFGNLIQGCTSAGPHYNPFNKTHGGPDMEIKHVGDCGNIEQKQGDSFATLELQSDVIKLDGPTSVIGRSFVVHKDMDDLGLGPWPDSNTTGHSGPRVACGVIGISGNITDW